MKNSRKYRNRKSNKIIKAKLNKNFVLVVFLLTVFAVFQLLLRATINKTLTGIEEVRNRNHQLSEDIALLRIDSTKFTSLENIRGIAEKELDMIDATSGPTVLKYYQIEIDSTNMIENNLTMKANFPQQKKKMNLPAREVDDGGIE